MTRRRLSGLPNQFRFGQSEGEILAAFLRRDLTKSATLAINNHSGEVWFGGHARPLNLAETTGGDAHVLYSTLLGRALQDTWNVACDQPQLAPEEAALSPKPPSLSRFSGRQLQELKAIFQRDNIDQVQSFIQFGLAYPEHTDFAFEQGASVAWNYEGSIAALAKTKKCLRQVVRKARRLREPAEAQAYRLGAATVLTRVRADRLSRHSLAAVAKPLFELREKFAEGAGLCHAAETGALESLRQLLLMNPLREELPLEVEPLWLAKLDALSAPSEWEKQTVKPDPSTVDRKPVEERLRIPRKLVGLFGMAQEIDGEAALNSLREVAKGYLRGRSAPGRWNSVAREKRRKPISRP